MAGRTESVSSAITRFAQLQALQAHYKDFPEFLYAVMEDLLGFNCTDIQVDIALYLQHGPQYIMIQAQRGQAKTTITAAFAVWCLIHHPRWRIVIVSSRKDMATEIANWIIQIMRRMPELECMLPDESAGDRASILNFDLHHSLKGAEKSPSVKCMSLFGGMSGIRADLLVADDIETGENSLKETQRALLRQLTKEFSSICSTGRIVYLGTPQNFDTIYNDLPGRGFSIRIWPGRYPTKEEEAGYGGLLAPLIIQRMQANPSLRTGGGLLGDRGQVTDPVILSESEHQKKELDQGKSSYNLQFMLSTKLLDEERFPLRPERLIWMEPPTGDKAPIGVHMIPSEDRRILLPLGYPVKARLYRASGTTEETAAFQGTYMYVDPAGGGANGDETGWAVTRFLAGFIWVIAWGGMPGGLHKERLDELTAIAKLYKPDCIGVEKNYGGGALTQVWQPILLKEHKCGWHEPWSTGQKELRIINTLEPLLGAGRIVINPAFIEREWAEVQKYSAELRASYCLLWQMQKITRDRNALLHDDRLETVAAACEYWVPHIAQDQEKAVEKVRKQAWKDKMKNPLNKPGGSVTMPGLQQKRTGVSRLMGRRVHKIR